LPKSAELHVGQNLRAMNGKECFDALDLEQQVIFDHDIQTIPAVEADALVLDREGYFGGDPERRGDEFMNKALLIDGLEEAWPQLTMNRNGTTQDRPDGRARDQGHAGPPCKKHAAH